MSAETGQLQRLTDEQVNARLAAYNGDGSLERDVKLLREKVGDLIESEVRNHFGAEAADGLKTHYSAKTDADWVQAVAEYGRRIFRERTSGSRICQCTLPPESGRHHRHVQSLCRRPRHA